MWPFESKEAAPAKPQGLPGGRTVQQHLAEVEAARGVGYASAVATALDYYHGTTRAQVVAALQAKFPQTWAKMVPVALSLFRRVVLEKACVYAGEDAGERFDLLADDGAPIEEAGGTTWREVLDAAQLPSKLTEANRWAEATRLAFLRIAWDADKGAPAIALFPPHKVFPRFAADSYAPDRAEWLLEVEPVARGGKSLRRFEFWSAGDGTEANPAQNFLILEDGERVDGATGGLSPYVGADGRSIVPIVPILGAGHDAGYWLPPDEQLVDAQRAIDAGWTSLLHLAGVSGYGQPVSETQVGASDAAPWVGTDDVLGGTPTRATSISVLGRLVGGGSGSVVAFGPDELVQVPRGRTFRYETAAAQFESLVATQREFLRQVCVLAGVPPASVLSEQRQVSGYALQVEREPVQRYRRESLRLYREPTLRAIAVLQAVWNAHQPSDATRFRGWPSWTPGEIAPPVDPEQRRRVDEVEIRIGVSSPVRVLMRDAGISREEALARAAEIAAENAPRLAAQGLGRLAAFGPAAEAARARVEMAAEEMMPAEKPAAE